MRNTLGKILRDKDSTPRETATVARTLYTATVIDVNPDAREVKVRVDGLDSLIADEKLPWTKPLLPQNVHIVPKLDDKVYIVLQNPWNPTIGRFYVGPITDESHFEPDTVSIDGVEDASVSIKSDNTISISTNRSLSGTPSVTLSSVEDTIKAQALDIVLSSTADDQPTEEFSIVYGERLVELLEFILKTLKTHQHPPNNIPINTFFTEADDWLSEMKTYLLNNHVRTK